MGMTHYSSSRHYKHSSTRLYGNNAFVPGSYSDIPNRRKLTLIYAKTFFYEQL